jgi:hypothetical protein
VWCVEHGGRGVHVREELECRRDVSGRERSHVPLECKFQTLTWEGGT